MHGVKLEYREGGPLGDTMMAGTAGLIEAIKRNENLNITL
jgi:pyruvate/2-oxoacid:ferredoxin oxidoreductase beta subunit